LKITKDQIVAFANEYYGNDYVVVYKRTGKDEKVSKIEKPQISKVEVNRDKISPFVEEILKSPTEKIKPVFLDYNKDQIRFSTKDKIPGFMVKNTENDLFSLYYVLDFGKNHDKLLAHSIEYLKAAGTSKYTPDEISRKFYDLACNYGVSVTDKQSFVYLSGPGQSFEQGLSLFEELLSDVKADQKLLDDIISKTLKGRNDLKLNKRAILNTAMRNYAMYGTDNPFKYQLTESELKALKAEQIGKEETTPIKNIQEA